MDAQSGQVQVKWSSAGVGNSPVFCWHMRSMTPFEKRPCKSSTSESMAPAQSAQMEFHRALGTADTFITTSYISEPLTCALISLGMICRSTTEPLRT